MTLTQGIALAVCLTCLSGCKPAESDYQSYLERLQNVLDIKAPLAQSQSPQFPAKRSLKQTTQASTLSIREFLSLRQCKIHVTIAHRNSLIGKVANDSQLLVNDLEILIHGPACLNTLEPSPLKQKLAEFLKQKEQAINTSLWNAIIADDEFQQFWRNTGKHQNYPKQLPAETVNDLLNVTQLIETIIKRDYETAFKLSIRLEQYLGNIRFGDGGLLVYEYSQLLESMVAANQLLETALKQPLCLNKAPNIKAKYFHNVVNKFFINQVQSRSVLLEQRKRQLLPAIVALESSLIGQAPKSFLDWQKLRDKKLNANLELTKHAQLIQKLFAQCGLNAGAPA